MRISFALILDFSLIIILNGEMNVFWEKLFFNLTKIEEDRVALDSTQYTPQLLQGTLSTRRSSYGVY
jgi:hypothetical protein